jgi:hypothetical protein
VEVNIHASDMDRHVILCCFTQETMVQNALDDVTGKIDALRS